MVAGSTENSTDEDASLAGRSPLVHVVHTEQVVVGPPVVGNDIVWERRHATVSTRSYDVPSWFSQLTVLYRSRLLEHGRLNDRELRLGQLLLARACSSLQTLLRLRERLSLQPGKHSDQRKSQGSNQEEM